MNKSEQKINIKNNDLICVECTRVFKSKKKLNRHFKETHLKIFPFKCGICEQKFKRKEGLKRHYRAKHLDIKFECKICLLRFCEKYKLRNHYKQEHDKNYCTNCEKLIVENIDTHICQEKQFKCYIKECNKVYSKQENLNNHISKFHNLPVQNFYEQKIEQKQQNSPETKQFFNTSLYGIKLFKLKDEKQKKIIQQKNIYLCDQNQCLKTFKRKYNLNTHRERVHKIKKI